MLLRILSILFFSIITIFFTSYESLFADSDPDTKELPPITMTGENTFGCLIDGEVFRPSGSLIGASFGTGINPLISYNEGSGGLKVLASNKQSGFKFSLVVDQAVSQIGVYKFDNMSGYENFDIGGCKLYNLIPQTSHLNLTKLDKVNDIASGTFYGEFINTCNDTISI